MLQREIQLIQEQQAKDDAARDRHYQEQLRMAQEQLKNATAELLTARTQELNRLRSRLRYSREMPTATLWRRL